MEHVVAGDPGDHAMIELSELDQILVSGGEDRVCKGATVCDGNGTHCEDRQGSCSLK